MGAAIPVLTPCCGCPARPVRVLPPFDACNLIRLGTETHRKCRTTSARRSEGASVRASEIVSSQYSMIRIRASWCSRKQDAGQFRVLQLPEVWLRPFVVNSRGCFRKVGSSNASELDWAPLLGEFTRGGRAPSACSLTWAEKNMASARLLSSIAFSIIGNPLHLLKHVSYAH